MMTDLFDTCLAIQCGAMTQQQAGMEQLAECSQAGYVGARVPWDPACSQFNEQVVGPVPVPQTMLVQPSHAEPTVVSHAPALSAQDLMLVLPNMPANIHPPSTGAGSPCSGERGKLANFSSVRSNSARRNSPWRICQKNPVSTVHSDSMLTIRAS